MRKVTKRGKWLTVEDGMLIHYFNRRGKYSETFDIDARTWHYEFEERLTREEMSCAE